MHFSSSRVIAGNLARTMGIFGQVGLTRTQLFMTTKFLLFCLPNLFIAIISGIATSFLWYYIPWALASWDQWSEYGHNKFSSPFSHARILIYSVCNNRVKGLKEKSSQHFQGKLFFFVPRRECLIKFWCVLYGWIPRWI